MENAKLNDVVREFAKEKYMCFERHFQYDYINLCIKNNFGFTSNDDVISFKKECVDTLVFYFETYDISKIQMRAYVRTKPSTWVLFDVKRGINLNTTFRGISQILDNEDNLFLLYGYKQNELKEINVYALNITDGLEKRNAKLNECFLSNSIFCELKENNFFGIQSCGVVSFGPVRRKNKLAPNTEYTFRKDDLFDVTLKYKDLSFEFEELFKNFYISFIGFYTTDKNGDSYFKGITNKNSPIRTFDVYFDELRPILNEYLKNL